MDFITNPSSWIEASSFFVNTGVALYVLLTAKAKIEPPIPGRAYLVRVVAVACGLAGGWLWLWARTRLDTTTLVAIGLWSFGIFVVLGVAYALLSMWLCITCAHDVRRYLAGLRLRPEVKALLGGKIDQPPPYGWPLQSVPIDVSDFFCNTGKQPAIVWRKWSTIASAALMSGVFLAAMIAGALALTSISVVHLRPPVEFKGGPVKKLEILSNILFEFDKDILQPDAKNALILVKDTLVAQNAYKVTISGHSDNIGQPAYNLALSERRALAVRNWLASQPSLAGVNFKVKGYGAEMPRAPNMTGKSQDSREERAANRRVEITFLGR